MPTEYETVLEISLLPSTISIEGERSNSLSLEQGAQM